MMISKAGRSAGGAESCANVQRGETNRRFKVKSDPGEILGASVQIKQTLCQRSSLGEPSIIRGGDYYGDVFNIQFQRCKIKGEGFFFFVQGVITG